MYPLYPVLCKPALYFFDGGPRVTTAIPKLRKLLSANKIKVRSICGWSCFSEVELQAGMAWGYASFREQPSQCESQ